MVNAYEAAHAEITEATKVYRSAREAYHTLKITDHVFVLAQVAYRKAEAKFDVAFAIAAAEPEDAPVVVADDQMGLGF